MIDILDISHIASGLGAAQKAVVDEILAPLEILQQNTPNPFNAQTTIAFELPREAEIQLAIYNLSGQRIRMLVNGTRAVGRYSAVWDGTDDAGQAVASGTYLYRLQAGTQVEMRKLLLLK